MTNVDPMKNPKCYTALESYVVFLTVRQCPLELQRYSANHKDTLLSYLLMWIVDDHDHGTNSGSFCLSPVTPLEWLLRLPSYYWRKSVPHVMWTIVLCQLVFLRFFFKYVYFKISIWYLYSWHRWLHVACCAIGISSFNTLISLAFVKSLHSLLDPTCQCSHILDILFTVSFCLELAQVFRNMLV